MESWRNRLFRCESFDNVSEDEKKQMEQRLNGICVGVTSGVTFVQEKHLVPDFPALHANHGDWPLSAAITGDKTVCCVVCSAAHKAARPLHTTKLERAKGRKYREFNHVKNMGHFHAEEHIKRSNAMYRNILSHPDVQRAMNAVETSPGAPDLAADEETLNNESRSSENVEESETHESDSEEEATPAPGTPSISRASASIATPVVATATETPPSSAAIPAVSQVHGRVLASPKVDNFLSQLDKLQSMVDEGVFPQQDFDMLIDKTTSSFRRELMPHAGVLRRLDNA